MRNLDGEFVWVLCMGVCCGFHMGISYWDFGRCFCMRLSYRILRGDYVCCIQLGFSNGDFV